MGRQKTGISHPIAKTVTLTPETAEAIEKMAIRERRTWATMARIILENATKTAKTKEGKS